MKRVFTLIIFIILSANLFGQFVDPHDTGETPPPTQRIVQPQVRPQRRVKPQKYTEFPFPVDPSLFPPGFITLPGKPKPPVRRITLETRYYRKLEFKFNGKYKLINRTFERPSTGFIVSYDIKKKISKIEYDGRRKFEIIFNYDAKNKLTSLMWKHNNINVMKFEYSKHIRYFIKMDLFNFIRATKDLILPNFSYQKVVYYQDFTRDKFRRITFQDIITEQQIKNNSEISEYYKVYVNKFGNWVKAEKFELTNSKRKKTMEYYAIHHDNNKIQNQRSFDVNETDKSLSLIRSNFYDYDSKNRITGWDIYLIKEGFEWEVLLETWKFGYENNDRYTISRENVNSNEYLTSAFVIFHLRPWLNRTDDFSNHVNILEGLGIGTGKSPMLGGALSTYIPIFKCFFVTIEISWDSIWGKGDGFRHTLNIFGLSANAVYILPIYQDAVIIGTYFGGGFGVYSADFHQHYNLGAKTMANQKAATRAFIINFRLGFCFIWNSGIFGFGGRYFIGKFKNFEEGNSKLYYSLSQGLTVTNTKPADGHEAEFNMNRFTFEIFIGFRL